MKIPKTFSKISTFVAASIILSSNAFAIGLENWTIPNFHSDITIESTGDVNIKETINADFTNEHHRGIERSIPYKYTNGYNSEIKYLNSTDEKGSPYFTEPYKQNGSIFIPMRTVDNSQISGPATFILNYLTKNSITFFGQDTPYPHDELYWNVNGTDWPVTINAVSATIHLPKSFKEEEIKVNCITGQYGAQGEECTWKMTDDQTIEITGNSSFPAYNNMTITVGMPSGTITPPTTLDRIIWFITENKIIFLPILTLILMISIWYKYGRDDQSVKMAIMPEYKAPEGVLPSEVGTIIDEKLDPRDIIATIIDYAVRGYIRINEIEEKGLLFNSKDYELELLKPFETTKAYENTILNGIFSINQSGTKKKISALKNTFFAHVPIIKKQLAEGLIKDDYFKHNPDTVRNTFTGIGMAIVVISWAYLSSIVEIGTTISLIATGLIISIVGRYMPARTKKGTEAYYHLKGLHEYIDTAEKDRMKFQEKNNILFEKLLPYAMAFGLISKWTRAFEGIIQNPPDWYSPYGGWHQHPFTMIYFADAMNNVTSSITTNIMQAPGSKGGSGGWSGGSGFGGGGFSGGGFGGGGGRGL